MSATPFRWLAFVTGVAALGGFLFGYDTAVIAGAMGALRDHFQLDRRRKGWAGASAIYGCLPGALAAGFLADRFGRKRLLLVCAVLYAGSGIWSAFASTFPSFLLSRLAGGLAIGISSMVCPTYIAEIAPERRRGFLGTLFQLGIVDRHLPRVLHQPADPGAGRHRVEHGLGWRWMLGSESIPAVVFLALLAWVPESPRWLALRGRSADAEAVLVKVSGPSDARHELDVHPRGRSRGTGAVLGAVRPRASPAAGHRRWAGGAEPGVRHQRDHVLRARGVQVRGRQHRTRRSPRRFGSAPSTSCSRWSRWR